MEDFDPEIVRLVNNKKMCAKILFSQSEMVLSLRRAGLLDADAHADFLERLRADGRGLRRMRLDRSVTAAAYRRRRDSLTSEPPAAADEEPAVEGDAA